MIGSRKRVLPLVGRILVGALALLAAGCSRSPGNAEFVRRIPWAERGVWLKADTHVHTTFSDGAHPVEEVAAKAVEHGCDVLAITDHADRNLAAATPEYERDVLVARRTFPDLVLIAGLEWNVPPFGGDVHATVLLPDRLDTVDRLRAFKTAFDDRDGPHEDELRARGLSWLEEHGARDRTPPVVMLNHPSRSNPDPGEIGDWLAKWREEGPSVAVGFSGAPGHQAREPIGAYEDTATVHRWDPAVEVGGAWDVLLQRGHDVWAARAPSDFHAHVDGRGRDYWPGEFSETWLYAPERSADGALAAFRAGSFFAGHGHVVRKVRLLVNAEGLDRPAGAGEAISAPAGAMLKVRLELEIPTEDWRGRENQLDRVELIAVTEDGAELLLKLPPNPSGPAFETDVRVPPGGIVLRARGRREEPLGPDLMFHTNPVRVVAGEAPVFAAWIPSPSWTTFVIGGACLVALAFGTGWWLRQRGSTLPRAKVVVRRPAASPGLPAEKGRDPRRPRWILWGAALTCFVLSATLTLTPFRFQQLEFGEAWSRFLASLQRPGFPSRVDFVANGLAFAATAYVSCAAAVTSFRGKLARLLAGTGVVLCCAAFSVLLEFSQVWTPNRVPSQFDVLAQWTGTLAGGLAWLISGRFVEDWLRRFETSPVPSTRLDLLLQVSIAALVLGELFPFDLTVHPVHAYRQVRDNLPRLLPFAGGWSADAALVWLFHGLLYLPVGLWCGSRRRRRTGLLFGLALPLLVECAQLLVASRHGDGTDVVIGTGGVLAGLLLVRGTGSERDRPIEDAFPWRWTAAVYLVIPTIFVWSPFAFSFETGAVTEALRTFVTSPFHRQQQSHYLAVMDNLWRLAVVFLPLGVLLGLSDARSSGRLRRRVCVPLAALLGFSFELGQVFLPMRYADVTDACVSAAAAVGGVCLVRAVLSPKADTARTTGS